MVGKPDPGLHELHGRRLPLTLHTEGPPVAGGPSTTNGPQRTRAGTRRDEAEPQTKDLTPKQRLSVFLRSSHWSTRIMLNFPYHSDSIPGRAFHCVSVLANRRHGLTTVRTLRSCLYWAGDHQWGFNHSPTVSQDDSDSVVGREGGRL